MKFEELQLKDSLLAAVQEMGFEEATPIQEKTIPLALEGKDVIGQAQTGTGKTAAFGLPLLQHIRGQEHRVQGLVISPTRELALQTQEELYRLGQAAKVTVQAVYGGADIGRQIRLLKKGPHIIVGTPGRLLDHIRRGSLKLDHVHTLILDEADEMLNMGFLEDIEAIIKEVPENRQTLMFSATMPDEIKRIGIHFMKDPTHVAIKAKQLTANLIDQYFIKAKEYEKFDIMTRLLDAQTPELTIVFGRTKRRVDELARGLAMRGYQSKGIHGDLPQNRRIEVLKDFKAGAIDILVATDVAARGLDISGVTHVYNYDIPQDPESYVHRIGRTGRAGHEGMSITFVNPNEMEYLRVIEDLTKTRMTPMRPPTEKEAFKGQLASAREEISQLMDDPTPRYYQEEIASLCDRYSKEELASALLRTMAKDKTAVKVTITPEKPLPRRSRTSRSPRDNFRKNDQRRSGRSGHHTSHKGKFRKDNQEGKQKKREKGKTHQSSPKRKGIGFTIQKRQ